MEDLNGYLRFIVYEEMFAAKRLEDIQKELAKYEGKSSSIVVKRIRGHLYYYEQWRENGRVRSRSLGAVKPGSIADIEESLTQKQRLAEEAKNLQKLIAHLQTAKSRVKADLSNQPILNDYSFEVYWKDEITARVYVRRSEVIVSRFVEHPLKQIFAQNRMTRNQLNQIFELRCWDRNRPDLHRLLRGIGLDEFNPQKIVRRTHGVMWNDYIWFRFPGEKLTCKDVMVRE